MRPSSEREADDGDALLHEFLSEPLLDLGRPLEHLIRYRFRDLLPEGLKRNDLDGTVGRRFSSSRPVT